MSLFKKIGSGITDYIRNTDKLLLVFCALASVYGCLLVYSVAQTSGTGKAGYLIQFAACAAGFVLAIIISKIDYELICRGWPIMAVVSLVLMALTFTSLGRNVAGTDDTAWLTLPLGPYTTTFQPAELLKIVFIVTFAKHLTAVHDHINRPLTVLLLCLHAMLPIGLVFLQGDYGTALVFIFIFVCMLFAGGLRPLYFLIGLIGVTAAVPVLWQVIGEDKRDRILSLIFVDDYVSTTGWQQYLGHNGHRLRSVVGSGLYGGRRSSGICPQQRFYLYGCRRRIRLCWRAGGGGDSLGGGAGHYAGCHPCQGPVGDAAVHGDDGADRFPVHHQYWYDLAAGAGYRGLPCPFSAQEEAQWPLVSGNRAGAQCMLF